MSTRAWKCQRQGCENGGIQDTCGRLKKWCSERCRKSQYDLQCADCGKRVSGTDPGKRPDPGEPLCFTCATDRKTIWTADAICMVINEMADDNGGIPPSAVDFAHAKHRGMPVPTVNHVMNRFGTWNAAIRAAGFEPHACGPVGGFSPLTTEARAECARRYAAGESSVAISADLGVSPATVLRWVRAAGVKVRPTFGQAAA